MPGRRAIVHNRFWKLFGQAHQILETDEPEEFLICLVECLITFHEPMDELAQYHGCPTALLR